MSRPGEIEIQSLRPREAYALLTSIISPRPIAWVSTMNKEGRKNLAPFSYYQALCSSPAMIMLSIGTRRDGSPKDTLANILATEEFVVNHVNSNQARSMQLSAAEVDEDEWTLADVLPSSAKLVRPPRVQDSRAALECRMTHAIPLGEGPHGGASSTVIFAKVLHIYLEPQLDEHVPGEARSAIAPKKLDSLGRLGGGHYCCSDESFLVKT